MKTLYQMLANSSWGRQLSESELDRVCSETIERQVRANAYVARVGQPSDHWIGVIDGLLKMSMSSPDGRITTLAGLFNPDLYPDPGAFVDLTQNEIGLLSGTSRQRTNSALQGLQREGLIRIEGRGVTVIDLDGLRSFAGVLADEATEDALVS